MTIGITGIGTANPSYKRKQSETCDLIIAGLQLKSSEKRLLKAVYQSTGIEYRHSVLSDYVKNPGDFTFFPNDPSAPYPTTQQRMQVYQENVFTLAKEAIEIAWQGMDKKTITHLITISCTGMYAPGLDIEIVQQLGLSTTVQRTAINFMGCYGAFNGLKVADSICKANPNAKVLMVCIELCTLHFQKKMDLDNIIANAIFADGAAAVVLESSPKNKKHLSFQSFYSDLVPQSGQQMAWGIGDTGFDIVLSSYVPTTIESGIAAFADRILKNAELNIKDIDYFAIHPGGNKILQACEKALRLTAHDNRYSYSVLSQYGNMSSATVLFVLKAIWDDLTLADHNKSIYSCAFGPGLTLESMLLKCNID